MAKKPNPFNPYMGKETKKEEKAESKKAPPFGKPKTKTKKKC